MDDLISRHAALDAVDTIGHIATLPDGDKCIRRSAVEYTLFMLPSEQPAIIRCKDCKNQEKFFQKDGRRKDGGYYIYGCSLAEEYSHVCLDDDYCSRAERRTDE